MKIKKKMKYESLQKVTNKPERVAWETLEKIWKWRTLVSWNKGAKLRAENRKTGVEV